MDKDNVWLGVVKGIFSLLMLFFIWFFTYGILTIENPAWLALDIVMLFTYVILFIKLVFVKNNNKE